MTVSSVGRCKYEENIMEAGIYISFYTSLIEHTKFKADRIIILVNLDW